MKKLFTLMVMALVAMSASAAQLDLSLDDLGAGWNSSYDAATKTITYEDAWKGRGWWLEAADYSAYDNVVIDFETQDLGVQLVIEYNNDVKSTTQWVDAGKTQIIATLDATGKASVKQLYIQSSKAGTVVLKRAYVATSDAVEKEAVKDLVLSTGDNLTLAAGGYGWNCPQSWLAKDVTEYNTMIFEIASIEGGAKTTVQLVPAAGGDAENLEIPFVTSSEAKTYALDISAYNTLNQFAYQNTNKGADEDETAIKESKVIVTKVYLTAKARSEFPENPTADAGEEATATTLIDYPTKEDGITLGGSCAKATVKIHNADEIPGIKFANSYTSEGAVTVNKVELSVDGGFKKGDVITIAGAFNNSDNTKKSAVDLFTLDGTTATVLFTTNQFINGKDKEADPVEQTYTLTADADKLYLGRNGNTATYVTLLKVTRGGATGIQETVAPVKVINNGVIYNLAGQKVNENYKGIVIKNGKKYFQK